MKAIVVSKKTGGSTEAKKELAPEREERIEIKFSVTKEVFNQFEELKAEFSNQLGSDLSIEAVFGRLLKLHRDRQKKNALRSTASPCTDKRRIPVSIKKEVLERDQRQCTYIAPDGTRCTERHYLNFDHIVPFAKGGSSKSLNLRLLCSRHNKLLAEQV